MSERVEDIANELVKAFTNPNKTKILLLLEEYKKLSISEIHRFLDISYQGTYKNVKEMIEAGLLKREHQKDSKHQKVYVSLRIKFPPEVEYV